MSLRTQRPGNCCYGNDVYCSRCGAWVVFSLAAKLGVDVSAAAASPA